MKIYVVSASAYESNDLLIKQLARIVVQPNKAIPVIVIDDLFNLDQLSKNDAPVPNEIFQLSDFEGINQGERADITNVASRLATLKTEWVQFEFDHSDLGTFIGFVQKLSCYNYMVPMLRKKNVVFTVPGIDLLLCARMLNESFNNLSCSPYAVTESGRVGRLFLLTTIQRLFISLPLLSALLIRFYRLAKSINRRFIKAKFK